MTRKYRFSRIDKPKPKVVWHKDVVGFLHLVNMVEPTLVDVLLARQVVSSVVKNVTSRESALRTNKVEEIRAIELNFHQLFHQTELHLYEPLLVPAEGQTVSIQ